MTSKFIQFGREIKGSFILVFSLLILFPSFTLKLQGEEKKLCVKTELGFIQADFVEGIYEISKKNEPEKKQLGMKKEEPNYDFQKKIRVVVDRAMIRVRPDVKSAVILEVEIGTILLSSDKIGEWYKVGTKAFIHQNFVQEIQEEEEVKPTIPPLPEKKSVVQKEIISEEKEDSPPEQTKRRNYNIKMGIHYFSPSWQSIKDVYGSGMGFRAEVTIFVWRNFAFWIGGSYFHKNGMLTFTEEETKLTIFPIGGGIKYRKLFGDISLYLGIGLNYFQFKESNPIGDVSKSGLGYIGLLGGSVKLTEGLLLNVYSNYSYCKMTPADFEIDVGGFEVGIGLVYEF